MTLEDPTDPEQMYLDPSGAVPVARPIMTGDVFTDVPCSRGGKPQTVMVVTHPCSMRTAKARLRDIVTVAAVVDSPHPTFSARRWTIGAFDYMPLNDVPAPGAKSAVHLADLHAAKSADLDLDRRIMSLSEYGITVFLQRWIYQLSRDPVPLRDLDDLIAPLLTEAEISEDWARAAMAVAEDQAPVDQVLAHAAERVQELLGRPGSGGPRDRLSDSASRPGVRRAIALTRVKELGQ